MYIVQTSKGPRRGGHQGNLRGAGSQSCQQLFFLKIISMDKMKKDVDVKVQVDVPAGFNNRLINRVFESRARGSKISKAKEIIRLAIIGDHTECEILNK
jgi:hypothetical protein